LDVREKDMNTTRVILLIASLSGLLLIFGYFIGRKKGVDKGVIFVSQSAARLKSERPDRK